MKEVELPDGTIVEFPDDMPDEDIAGVLRKQMAAPVPQDAQGRPEPPVSPEVAARRAELRSRPRAEQAAKVEAMGRYAEGGGPSLLDVTGAALQGVPFVGTFSDEASAGLDAALGYDPKEGYFSYPGMGKSYEASLGAQRGRLNAYRERFPVTSMTTEAAGSLPLMAAGTGALGSKIGAALAPATGSILGNIGRGAAAAAPYGYAYGLGAGEGGAGNRTESANRTALISALLGGGFAAGGELAPRLGNAAGRLVNRMAGGTNQSTPELRKYAQAILAGKPGAPPDAAMKQAEMKLAELGPEAVGGDINRQTQLLTGTIHRQGGAPQTVIRDKVIPRQEGFRNPETEVLSGGQYGRLSQKLNELVPDSMHATRQRLSKSSEPEQEFYRAAYAANPQMDSPVIRNVLEAPEAKKALQLAIRQMQNRVNPSGKGRLVSKPDPELTAVYNELRSIGKIKGEATGAGVGKGFKLETLDRVKRALDRIGDAGQISDNAMTRQGASDARHLAKVLRNELDRLDVTAKAGPKSLKIEGGEYAQARARAQKRLRAKKALKSGEHFMTEAEFRDPEEMQAVLAAMMPEELEALRIGAAGYLKRKIGDAAINRDATRQLYGVPNLEEKVRLLFGDPQTFAKYIRGARAEREMYGLYSEIEGGSQTQERQTWAKALEGEPAGAAGTALDLAAGAATRPASTLLGAIPRGARAIRQWASRMPEGQRMRLAQALMGRDLGPLQRQANLAGISDEKRRQLIRALAGVNLAATPMRARPELERPY